MQEHWQTGVLGLAKERFMYADKPLSPSMVAEIK